MLPANRWYRATVRGLGLTAVVLAAALAGCGSNMSSSNGGNGSSSTDSGGGGAEIDSCVVGSWVATGVSTTFSVTGAVVTLNGGAGLKLTFGSDGSETADWSSMVPLSTTVPVDVMQTYHGESHYRVATANGTLTFLSADYSGWSGQQSFAGQVSNLVGPDPVPAEAYSCSASTFTEHNAGWQATFTRH